MTIEEAHYHNAFLSILAKIQYFRAKDNGVTAVLKCNK